MVGLHFAVRRCLVGGGNQPVDVQCVAERIGHADLRRPQIVTFLLRVAHVLVDIVARCIIVAAVLFPADVESEAVVAHPDIDGQS